MNNAQNEKIARLRETAKTRQKIQDIKNIRVCNTIFAIISSLVLVVAIIALFTAGSGASVATGPVALLLIPLILVAVTILGFVCGICVIFFGSMVRTYATTVENIQTITDIVTEAHNSKNADANENVTADKTTSAE